MKYVFITLLIINSIAFVFKGWLYYIFVLASIVAFLCVAKVNNRQSIFYIIASALSGASGIVFALAYFNGRIFMLGATLFIFFLALAIVCINEKPQTKKNDVISNSSATSATSSAKAIYHKYLIDSNDTRLKNFFDIIDEYYTAADYEDDGEHPYYTYRHLNCHLENKGDQYKVLVETKKDFWEYIGTVARTDALADDLYKCKKYYVDVDGGTQHIISKGKNEKEWQPLKFTLVICLRND